MISRVLTRVLPQFRASMSYHLPEATMYKLQAPSLRIAMSSTCYHLEAQVNKFSPLSNGL